MKRVLLNSGLIALSLVIASCQSTNPLPTPPGSPPGTSVVVPTPSALSSRAVTTAAELGPIIDGIPTRFGGLPVLRGDALRTALAASTDASPFLAGGWFQSIYSVVDSFCSAVVPPRTVDTCANGLLLYDEQVGWTRTAMTGGATSIHKDLLTLTADRPAVLLLHSMILRAATPWRRASTVPHLPVVSTVEWMGPIASARPSPTPVGTPPATSISRGRAVALAELHSGERAGVKLRVRCVAVAPYSSIWSLQLPPPQPDAWLWSIVFVGGRWASDKVSLDYPTGAFVTAAGDDWVQTCIGDGAPAP